MKEYIQLIQETDLQAATIRCKQFALKAGLSSIATQKLVTAVSELTRNVCKYAQCQGRVNFLFIKASDGDYVQVDVIDHGPGIEDLDQAMADNYSSSGTLGLGLPGVRRLVDHFEIESTLGQGTRVSIQMK